VYGNITALVSNAKPPNGTALWAVYGNITALVSNGKTPNGTTLWKACREPKYIGDDEIVCQMPAVQGRRDIRVEVQDGTVRSGELLGGFLGVQFWAGAADLDPTCGAQGAPWPQRQDAVQHCTMKGTLLFGPSQEPGGAAGVGTISLNMTTGVRALAVLGNEVLVAGSMVLVNNTRVNGILGWDGQRVSQRGLGVDGTVNAMQVYSAGGEENLLVYSVGGEENLLVAGSFTRAYGSTGSVYTGGVALWNQAQEAWSALGGEPASLLTNP
ncbi:hypothetical protein T484DRAFT_1784390, partial [Baffinella frigidus]